jgi:spoIIIJ-associated protein
MNETQQKAQEFLSDTIRSFGFDLEVSASENEEGYVFDLRGKDSSLLLNEGGEALDAFETILFQVFGREIERDKRFICDAEGFRQTRRAELQAMARFAAQTVRKSSAPFTFGKLNSSERRVIHLVLQQEPDLHTESVGDGRDRRLRVSLK